MNTLSISRVGLSLSGLFVVSYVLCVGYDLVVSESWQMYPVWERLLPGFVWLSWGSFFLGLVEAFLYGWYGAVVLVPLYNLLNREKGHVVQNH